MIKKTLSKEQWIERGLELLDAHKVFIDSGVTKNLSIAYELWIELCAAKDRQRQVFLTTKEANSQRRLMDEYERPRCPEDDFEMMFRPVPENPEGVKVQLICTNPDHVGPGSVLNSPNDLNWWMQNLEKNKDESKKAPKKFTKSVET